MDLRLHGYDSLEAIPADLLREAKRLGFSDFQIGRAIGMEKDHDMEEAITLVRRRRKALGIIPCVKQIDTLAAEYPARTNYLYLTYGGEENDIDYEKRRTLRGGARLWCLPHRQFRGSSTGAESRLSTPSARRVTDP